MICVRHLIKICQKYQDGLHATTHNTLKHQRMSSATYGSGVFRNSEALLEYKHFFKFLEHKEITALEATILDIREVNSRGVFLLRTLCPNYIVLDRLYFQGLSISCLRLSVFVKMTELCCRAVRVLCSWLNEGLLAHSEFQRYVCPYCGMLRLVESYPNMVLQWNLYHYLDLCVSIVTCRLQNTLVSLCWGMCGIGVAYSSAIV